MTPEDFQSRLSKWHEEYARELPWKETRDPYLIWLSEIILQQTRVQQGLPYYQHFHSTYPTVEALANAPQDKVLKSWEGLGYYSRARNLHAAAKYVTEELNGIFPDSYDGLLKLKGVGPYTAAAIASFAFDLPHAVVDGNVYRVLARIFGIDTPIDTTSGKKEFAALADKLLDQKDPAGFNQAMMDFGALQCTPGNPDCDNCPMASHCFAWQHQRISDFPVKSKAKPKKERFFHYLVFTDGKNTLIEKRTEKDIWQGLYQFPLLELSEAKLTAENLLKKIQNAYPGIPAIQFATKTETVLKQTLSHQRIFACFWTLQTDRLFVPEEYDWKLVQRSKLATFAFPRIIDRYLND
ncbi:MAG: A/G-specific adenine glycosylase [Bacteroidetes bacterium]|nr:A/G-specific adenine glycosylase [Bacteroidota bacterium]